MEHLGPIPSIFWLGVRCLVLIVGSTKPDHLGSVSRRCCLGQVGQCGGLSQLPSLMRETWKWLLPIFLYNFAILPILFSERESTHLNLCYDRMYFKGFSLFLFWFQMDNWKIRKPSQCLITNSKVHAVMWIVQA